MEKSIMIKVKDKYHLKNLRFVAFVFVLIFICSCSDQIDNTAERVMTSDSVYFTQEFGQTERHKISEININHWSIDSLSNTFFAKKIIMDDAKLEIAELKEKLEKLLKVKDIKDKITLNYDSILDQIVFNFTISKDTFFLRSNIINSDFVCFKYQSVAALFFDFKNKIILSFCYDPIMNGQKISSSGLLNIQYLDEKLFPQKILFRKAPFVNKDDSLICKEIFYEKNGKTINGYSDNYIFNIKSKYQSKYYYRDLILNSNLLKSNEEFRKLATKPIGQDSVPIWMKTENNYLSIW